MWEKLAESRKNEYRRLILAFASLTDMFAQKAMDANTHVAPIINSKFQETAFQRAFDAAAEDIGNTSYDVSLSSESEKYLVGIKTFGVSAGDQKVAQFKANHDDWAAIIDKIKHTANHCSSKEEIDLRNSSAYLKLATKIAKVRNERIDSAYANIKGFNLDVNDTHVHSVYHVLMPSDKKDAPKIYVGETSYDRINIDSLEILGCTGKNNPTNFVFTDGNHTYKYTSADSQLHMNFNNKEIICDEWDVTYATDPHAVFEKIYKTVFQQEETVEIQESKYSLIDKAKKVATEEYCWTIWNKDKAVELFSGFNSFYGVGSKLAKANRIQRIENVCNSFSNEIDEKTLNIIRDNLDKFLIDSTFKTKYGRDGLLKLRKSIIKTIKATGNMALEQECMKLLFRPMSELYIPIPQAHTFHSEHPDFFRKGAGKLIPGTSSLALTKEERTFNLVFDPSGDMLQAYITQDDGKGIESTVKQSYLGEWILRGIFQLEEYEPLTEKKLLELNINGIKLSKYKDSDDVHIEFIWIDEEDPPSGYISRK